MELIKQLAQDPFATTMAAIIIVAIIGALIRRNTQDKCLKSFTGDHISVETTDGREMWGRIHLEHTGFELTYIEPVKDTKGIDHTEHSYLWYRSEFPSILLLVRYLENLNDKARKDREDEIRRAYHPSLSARLVRRLHNQIKSLKDTCLEIINLVLGTMTKNGGGASKALADQKKYIDKAKTEVVNQVTANNFEPLLERHIGHKVVAEITKGDVKWEYVGILKEYTGEFIELLDVDYQIKKEDEPKRADIIMPRKLAVIRHRAE